LNKLGPKHQNLRPLQKLATATVKPIPESKEEDEELLPSNLTIDMKLLIGHFPAEK
jgi:hypothetical protein